MRYWQLCAVMCAGIISCSSFGNVLAEEPAKKLRAGMIGLDTSHCVEFTKVFNDPGAVGDLADIRVVAAFPGGSPDIPSSWDRVKGYTDALRGMGVEIVDSIDQLLPLVDVVLLESVDGRPHLAQARPVIDTGKPLFIDKPMAASLADVMRIFRLAKAKGVPCFSSSSLRFSSSFQAVRNGTAGFGDVRACTAWGPMNIEPHHPDLFWYGIHGMEVLYTIMGTGCKTVTRAGPEKAVGVWSGGRQGVFEARNGYGATVEGSLKSGDAGGYDGYKPLLIEIARFFKTGNPPVSPEETIELFAFMEAADQSKAQGGQPVSIADVIRQAEEQIAADAK